MQRLRTEGNLAGMEATSPHLLFTPRCWATRSLRQGATLAGLLAGACRRAGACLLAASAAEGPLDSKGRREALPSKMVAKRQAKRASIWASDASSRSTAGRDCFELQGAGKANCMRSCTLYSR